MRYLKIEDSKIGDFEISQNTNPTVTIKIVNTQIRNLFTENYEKILSGFYMDGKSRILNDERTHYAELREANKSKVQKHIYHIKELRAY